MSVRSRLRSAEGCQQRAVSPSREASQETVSPASEPQSPKEIDIYGSMMLRSPRMAAAATNALHAGVLSLKAVRHFLWAIKIFFFIRNDIPLLDVISRVYFCYHYLPIIALVACFFLNATLQCVYNLIIPAHDVALEGSVSRVLAHLAFYIPPYFYLVICILFVGYKVSMTVADTMVDCFHSHGPRQYELLKGRVEHATSSRWTTVVSFWLVAFYVMLSFANRMMQHRMRTKMEVFTAVWSIIAFQTVFVIGSLLCRCGMPDNKPLTHARFFQYFWPWVVPKVRDLSLVCIMVVGLVWVILYDIMVAISDVTEMSVYLVLPHVFLNAVASLALTAGDFLECAIWVYSNPRYIPDVGFLMAVYFYWGLWTIMCLRTRDVVIMTTFAIAANFVRAVVVLKLDGVQTPLLKSNDRFGSVKGLLKRMIPLVFFHSLWKFGKDGWEGPDTHAFRPASALSKGQHKGRALVRLGLRGLGFFGAALIVGFGSLVIVQALAPVVESSDLTITPDGSGGEIFSMHHMVTRLEIVGGKAPAVNDDPVYNLYPALCTQKWDGLPTMDYAWFANGAYLSEENFKKAIDFYNRYTVSDEHPMDWELAWSATQKTSAVFYEVYSKSRNRSVITIRGTDPFRPTDYLQNLNMYLEVGVFHILSTFLPGFGLFPLRLVTDAIHLAAQAEHLAEFDFSRPVQRGRHYWLDILTHTEKISKERDVTLTGHSLGGALAIIAGSKLRHVAIAFHGPGVLLSHRKFGIPSPDRVHRYAVNVIPENDVVPSVDRMGGEVHNVLCATKRHDVCHIMESTVAELWTACHSVRRRLNWKSLVLEDVIGTTVVRLAGGNATAKGGPTGVKRDSH
eukprot:Sspe_Gene.15142::Locus_5257_Transcript_1_1_Confidence_1.000_Length_2715::g.15142::m.15142